MRFHENKYPVYSEMKSVITVLIGLLTLAEVWAQRFDQGQFQSSRNRNSFVDQPNVYNSRPEHSTVSCPEKNGRFPTRSCDGYIECEDGIGVEKVCPDGLLFNPATGIFHSPCQYPIDVDCTGREQIQSAQATEECPHQYGYYRIGDAANCGQFKNCVDGRGYIFDCPEGLAFNDETYRCDWPDQVPSCDAEAYLAFSCPAEARSPGLGEGEYRSFRSPSDCQRYFICIDGRPRLYNCGQGRAFNDLINSCDGVENVTGCTGSRPSSQYDHDIRPQYLTKKF